MINKKKALDDFQITEADYDELLAEFIVQADEKIVVIERSLREGNFNEAARQAHAFKGVAGNLRLDDCYRLASMVDGALKTTPPLPIDASLADLKRAVDEVRKSIRP